jgi:hypothetical protein
MRYAELGGFCLDTKYRGGGYSQELYRITFEVTNALDIDFLVTESVPSNLARTITAASVNGAQQIIPRPDIRTNDGNEDFRLFLSWKTEQDLPLLSARDKAAGLGKPLTNIEIEKLIERRQEIIKGRSNS